MGGTLPGVTTLMTAFDKILEAFHLNNQRVSWLYQTERLPPLVSSSES